MKAAFSLPNNCANLELTSILNDIHTQITITFHQQINLTLRIGGHFSTRVKIGLPHLLFTRNKKCT